MKLIRLIFEHIFGKKYYANIIWTRGTKETEMASFIHKTRAEAFSHRKQIESTSSFGFIETISFRSKKNY